jgi:hypothetical protein
LLNEIDFPPHSGVNVVFDDGGPITVSFATPVAAVGAFVTYTEGVTLTALDASDTPLGVVHSAFTNNTATGGDPGSMPNEFLQISSVLGISSVTFAGDPDGGDFVLDDLTFTPQTEGAAIVPEPRTLALLGGGLSLLLGRRLRHC